MSETTKAFHAESPEAHHHKCISACRAGSCGYHVCKCGATKGVAPTSEWIKSHAMEGWPGEFGKSRFA